MNGGCSQICTNSVGSYNCSCNQPGYVLFDVDGRSGYTIQSPDDGNRAGDVYHLGHSCVRKYYIYKILPAWLLLTNGNVINCPHAWQQLIVLMNGNFDLNSFLSSVFRINRKIRRNLFYIYIYVIYVSQKGRNCSEPAVVNNAMLMTKRAMHRYMDKITYMCDLGYVKSRGEETFTCGSDGQWTPSQTTNLLECSGQWITSSN